MKNKALKFMGMVMSAFILFGVASCYDSGDIGDKSESNSDVNPNNEIAAIYDLYVEEMKDKNKEPLSYSEWLQMVKGEKGETGDRGPQGEKGETGDRGPQGEKGEAGRGILSMEIIDGYLWVTYTDNPDKKVKIGKITPDEDTTLQFYLLENDTYGVKGGDDILSVSEIEIPDEYKGKKVTRILKEAFKSVTTLKKVALPNNIEQIGDNAFDGCMGLETINIPKTVKKIGAYAFNGCENLILTTLLDADEIGKYAFYNCAGINASIGSSVKFIGAYAFYGCDYTKITFDNSEEWASVLSSVLKYQRVCDPSMADETKTTESLYPENSLSKLIVGDVKALTVTYNAYWLKTGKFTEQYSTFSLYKNDWVRN